MAYKTVKHPEEFEYTEKHSRFIAACYPVSTKEEVQKIISEVKTKYWDARHNVYAYVLKNGEQKFSDDGEPHGTAGKPILDVILGRQLTDVLLVVTRYFGGILLGTGGLVRAYTLSAAGSLDKSEIIEISECIKCFAVLDYSDYSVFNNMLRNLDSKIIMADFKKNVELEFLIKKSDKEKYENAANEAFFGKISTQFGEICYENL